MFQSGSQPGSRSLRFLCRGHREIRALHHKTLEVIRGTEIGERATCVVGVGADYDPRSVALLVGPIELRLEAAGVEDVVTAEVSSFPSTEGGLVLRSSQVFRGNTFAVGADRGARDLNRRLVHALSDPEAILQVTLQERPSPKAPLGALFVLLVDRSHGPTPEERRALLASSLTTGPRLATLRPWIRGFEPAVEKLSCQRRGEVDGVLEHLGSGRRVSLGVTLEDLEEGSPTCALIADAAAAGIPVTCASEVSPWLRSLLVSGISPQPFVVCGRVERRQEVGALAVRAQGDETLVWWARGKELGRGLETIAELRGVETRALIARDAGGLRELFVVGALEHCLEEFQLQESRLQAFEGGSTTTGDDEWVAVVSSPMRSGEEVREALPEQSLLRALLAAEVPMKTLARAVATVTGTSKRDAYGALLALQGMAEEEE